MADAARTVIESERPGTWQTVGDRRVRLHTLPGSWAGSRAGTELRRTEKIVEELDSLLQPTREQRGDPLDIYLVDRIATDEPTNGAVDTSGTGRIVQVLQPDAPIEPIAWPVTRVLVARWFGAPAMAAGVVIDG